jgi:hypothetical protein
VERRGETWVARDEMKTSNASMELDARSLGFGLCEHVIASWPRVCSLIFAYIQYVFLAFAIPKLPMFKNQIQCRNSSRLTTSLKVNHRSVCFPIVLISASSSVGSCCSRSCSTDRDMAPFLSRLLVFSSSRRLLFRLSSVARLDFTVHIEKGPTHVLQ